MAAPRLSCSITSDLNGPYKIINVGSVLSRQAFLDVVPYAASKHAVLALINGGAKALVQHHIRSERSLQDHQRWVGPLPSSFPGRGSIRCFQTCGARAD